ncbi:MAG: histidine ammonia-lyase [Calditrichaeota bacterium]|nr:histidine ammonia-lyase [Calditrichota bacterium]
MKKLIIEGGNLTPEDVWQVAFENRPVVLSEGAIQNIQRARDVIEKAIAEKRTIYGVNTGFGKLSDVHISDDKIVDLQINLLKSHSAGVGEPIPEAFVRAIMLIKVNSLARGFSGVRVKLVQLLVDMLNRGVHPIVPEKGSVGASGDLAPLAHLSTVLIGRGEALYQGKRLPGTEALAAAGLTPIQLEAKEGISLINGTQFMSALGTMALLRAENLARHADLIGAMSAEALLGSDIPFDPRIQEVRGFQGQKDAAWNLTAFMEGSDIRESHRGCSRVQDAYSLRCMPQVHGAAREALAYVRRVITTEINAVTDNPLVFPENGDVLSGGNFHGEPIAIALDTLAIAVSELANISERRIAALMDSNISELPPFLAHIPGLHSGFMIAQVTAAALVSENKVLAHPSSVDSIPTSANQEDLVSMGAAAARKALAIVENSENVLAIEALCAAQGIDLRRPLKAGKGSTLAFQALREEIPRLREDRELWADIKTAAELIASQKIIRFVEKEIRVK